MTTPVATRIDSPEALREVMRADFTVSPQQWEAISAPLEPAVVIAGAGSGKTSVMAARVVYLVATGQVTPDQVLGLTFTTKAAHELMLRIRGALDAAGHGPPAPGSADAEDVLEPLVATYNAYASSLLTQHGLRLGHEPDTRVMADASRYQLAARVIERHTGRVDQLSDSPKHVIDYILKLDGALSEHLVSPDDLAAFDAHERELFAAGLADAAAPLAKVESAFARRAEAMALVREYRALKAAYGLMDFSDQIALAAQLAAEHPVVGELERDKYAVVLLDEYQDTSVAQAQMLSSLFGGGHPVTAVGDPNQAIYGWRGASVSNILHFGQDFPAADGQVARYALTVNRRSDRRILEVANALAAPLYDAFAQVDPLEPGTDDDGSVDTIVHLTSAAELAWLAEQVPATHGAMETPSWREIGVLVRDNAHAADVFDALTAVGVPVEIVGLAGLLRLPEVAEVLATLTLVDDLTANAELLTLLTGPRWAIGPRDLALLGTRAGELAESGRGRGTSLSLDEELARAVAGADPTELVALSDALDDPGDLPYSPAARQRFSLLASELRYLRSHAGEPLLELVRRIIDACGLDVELASSVSEAGRARRENLDLFVKAVADFQAVDGTVSLTSLLAWLQAEDDLGEGLDVATPSEADSVKLLTVHRAKGLEWDAVFLVGMCAERFPHTRSRGLWPERVDLLPTPLRGDRRDLPALRDHTKAGLARLKEDTKAHEATEELRLGYVAFTRARHRLVVSSYVWAEGRAGALGPSPFQETVRDAMAGWGGVPLAWEDKPEKGVANPLFGRLVEYPWPVAERTAEALRRVAAAELVGEALDRLAAAPGAAAADPGSIGARPGRAGPGARVGRRAGPPGGGGASGPGAGGRGAAAGGPVGDHAPAAPPGPGRARRRPGPADAAAPGAGRALRHPVPRVGRAAVRAAGAARARGGRQPRRRRHRRLRRPARADRDLRGRSVRDPGAVRRGGAVRPGARRPGGARPDRRGLRRARRRLPPGRLEDQPHGVRGPAPAGGLPARVVGADRRPARPGPGRVLLRAHGCAGHPRRPARSRGARGAGQAGLSAAVSAISTIAPKVSWRSSAVVSSPVTMWSATVAMVSARRPYFAARV